MTQPDTPETKESDESAGPFGLIVLLVVLALIGWWSLWALAIVFAIVFFIFMHELGHFVTARRTGMKATEFFIGFGPKLWSFKRGETEYGVKAIWAGAYVRIIGMNNLDEVDPADEQRTYRSKSYPRRVLVASAGSLMHFGMAIVMLFALFTLSGVVRDTYTLRVADIEGSAAAQAGLQDGDRLLSVAGEPVDTFDDLVAVVEPRPGETVEIVYERDGAQRNVVVTLGSQPDDPSKGRLGVGPLFDLERDDPLSAAGRSVTEFGTMVQESVKGIGRFFSPTNLSDFVDRVFSAPGADDASENPESRPVSIIGVVQIGSQVSDVWGVVFLLALLNVFIGIFNLIPLLPLDGGHIAIATYERIRSIRGEPYTVDTARLLPLVYGVFLFLVLFGLGAVYLDIANPISLR